MVGGALAMFGGAALLALASSTQAASHQAKLGIIAALGAGIWWGTMYIPYRKAYLTGMNPLSFITFFTFGELGTMTALALSSKGAVPLWHEIVGARAVLFWLMLGGFVWVIGDLFQQYAAKYVGISRGVPLSNTNQLWGLVWGILVFHELRGGSQRVYTQVIGGSILMPLGAVAIALSSASGLEHSRWRAAAEGVGDDYMRAGIEGRETGRRGRHRTFIDWLLVASVTAIFGALATMARNPSMDINLPWAALVSAAMLVLLVGCSLALWRTTRFS